MSIGILTFHRCINYGSFWQTHSLAKGIQELGLEPIIIDHRSPQVDISEWRCALRPTPKSAPRERKGMIRKTRKVLDKVATLPLSDPIDLNNPNGLDEFSTVVVGSDEVWNLRHPWYAAHPIFFGQGLKTERLVSYAASFGSYSCWEGIGSPWTDFLLSFDCLSVRDENSWWMLKNCIGREPELVLDPCLTWPPEVHAQARREPYVLVYGHTFSNEYADRVKGWANDQKLRLISIGYRNDWVDENRLGAGPDQFAESMSGAVAVATNFFHGCVFALANNKPFACESSPYRNIKIRGLMELLRCDYRLGPEVGELLSAPLDPRVHAKISQLRRRSKDYLRGALNV